MRKNSIQKQTFDRKNNLIFKPRITLTYGIEYILVVH